MDRFGRCRIPLLGDTQKPNILRDRSCSLAGYGFDGGDRARLRSTVSQDVLAPIRKAMQTLGKVGTEGTYFNSSLAGYGFGGGDRAPTPHHVEAFQVEFGGRKWILAWFVLRRAN